MFQFCGFGEAFGFDGCGDGGPEAERFVGQLGREGGNYFGGGEEGFEVEEEGGVLLGRLLVGIFRFCSMGDGTLDPAGV